MKVSGFTFIRNGTLLGYPYIESIKSLLSLCDEVVVAVGESRDDTLNKVLSIGDPKLRIIETTWNESIVDRGYVYAQQKMIAQFNCSGDWAFYLECDEILHENDIPLIKAQMIRYLNNPTIEALVFDYYHFYGTPENIAISPKWYKRAPRIIRNTMRSWAPDGLFWLVMDSNKKGRYPRAALVNCNIYHYGHVRNVAAMSEKNKSVGRYWGNSALEFHGYGNVDRKSIVKFNGSHPKIISHWITSTAERTLNFNHNYKLNIREKRHRLLMIISKLLGIDFSKKHYRLITDNSI